MSLLKIDGLSLHDRIDIKNRYWKNLNRTNCYAYALGLDVPEEEIMDGAFHVLGKMAISTDLEMTDEDMYYISSIERLEMDLDFLHLKYEEAGPFDLVKDNEWLIAFFNCPYNLYGDFHFARRNDAGLWVHKLGWKGKLSVHDDQNKLIINPKKAGFDFYVFEKCLKLRK